MRRIALDTETTGLNPLAGHRIIEIGCVEIIDKMITGSNYHTYLNGFYKKDNQKNFFLKLLIFLYFLYDLLFF